MTQTFRKGARFEMWVVIGDASVLEPYGANGPLRSTWLCRCLGCGVRERVFEVDMTPTRDRPRGRRPSCGKPSCSKQARERAVRQSENAKDAEKVAAWARERGIAPADIAPLLEEILGKPSV